MLSKPRLLIILIISSVIALSGCSGKTQYRSSCASETDAATNELSISKAKGFGGTVSYAKAASRITAARTMQAVENFDNCYRSAKLARQYIQDSYRGE
ncbi:MAG: hypothetical protein EOO68_10280 [Moraxellaceae bacterium]|nr:MAG: hypothetical protein EOO68_10280 [Moraxellaceae bacterium]